MCYKWDRNALLGGAYCAELKPFLIDNITFMSFNKAQRSSIDFDCAQSIANHGRHGVDGSGYTRHNPSWDGDAGSNTFCSASVRRLQ